MEKESITENVRRGLSSAQAEESRRAHGENVLTPPKRTPLWKLYLEKYTKMLKCGSMPASTPWT